MRTLLSRLTGLVRGRRSDADLEAEVQFHLDMLAESYVRRGMTPADARAAAKKNFGGVTQMKEEYRDQRSLPWVETFVQDVRYGVRNLLRTPGFTVAALLTLALGVGANSAIFSVVNAVLLRPLPYSEPDRIVQMHRRSGGLWANQTGRRYLFFREHMQAFDALAAWHGMAFNLATGDSAEYVQALAVSKEYFTVFGGTPLFGRTFEPHEDLVNGPNVAILGHGLWRRLFASNPAVVGTSVSLADKSYTIVGVMPDGFDSIRTAELYVPMRPSTTGTGGGSNYTVAGRLKADVSRAEANAESESIFEAYKAAAPGADFGREQAPIFEPYQDSLARPVRPALLMMLGAVGMLLLIACANTANLLLARASGRGREVAVRAALGATRRRIVRQLLTESVVLFLAGGVAGVAMAYWAVPALLALTPAGYLPAQDVRIDATVLAVALGLSLLTGLIFGLAPAMTLSRHDLVEAFKEDGTRTTSSRRSAWLRRGLVVTEVALCMLLLVGAGLLIQTFVKLRGVDVGFDTRNVLTARMSLLGQRYNTSESVNRFYDQGLERLRRIPGVRLAAVVNGVPIERGLNLNFDRLDTAEQEAHLVDWRYASADYFATMGIPIVRGRGLTAADSSGAPRVAVVSEQLARQYFKDEDPIGKQILLFKPDGPIEIVGIAKDLREAGLVGDVPALMYVPVAQAGDTGIRVAHMYFQVSWVVKADRLTSDLAQRIREELRSVDPRQPITAFRSMDEVKSRAMANETFQMTLLAVFAGIGLVLAAAGIYGLIAYSVAQRTREFGIRLALGATSERIVRSVIGQGAALALAGVGVGTAAAFVLTRTLQQFLFGVSTLDAPTFVAVAVLLVAVAALASLVPALRAVRLNPVSALRE
jgi:predicted permease